LDQFIYGTGTFAYVSLYTIRIRLNSWSNYSCWAK